LGQSRTKHLFKKDAAALLGVTPARVSQLIRDGYLMPGPDGLISPDEVERCRRDAPIAWQLPGCKSGRPSHAELRERQAWRAWAQVEGQLARDGWDLRSDKARELWPLFRSAVARWAPDEL